MKSPNVAKQLECHGFVCQSPEDAIVIAATLYQNLMAHMGSSQVIERIFIFCHRLKKKFFILTQNQRSRKPKNRNGIGCMSIASSSAVTNALLSTKSSFRGSRSGSTRSKQSLPPVPPPSRPPRKKRSASNSLSSDSDIIRSVGSNNNLHPDFDTSSDERDKNKGSKPKKAPPLPLNPPNIGELNFIY